LENIIFSLEECTHEQGVSEAKKTDVLLLPGSKLVSVNTSTDELDTSLKTCVMAHHFYSKTSLIVNTTNNLAKLNEMLYNLFNLSSLKIKQPVKETCKPCTV
jgi:hypothetical protein